ncbi:thioredoxin domain-containing protein 15 [Coccinella septempunctata]|uniref:thioredoxin domain-containing protein 15 n=1 Tax=Coccinella septempunctata TaxID=41139 RepID=UPI001D074D9A|nr:thioredoxin domain-containing protein 15 [Coccinella septempunctata]
MYVWLRILVVSQLYGVPIEFKVTEASVVVVIGYVIINTRINCDIQMNIMISKSKTLVVLLLCFYYSSNADIINSNDVLAPETLPKLPKEIEDAVPDFTEKEISPNTTINIHNQSGLTNKTSSNNATLKIVHCLPNLGSEKVEIVNDTHLIRILTPDSNITSKDTAAQCVVVMFYSKYGTFSSMAAPHFNALPRAFPDIKMVAINTMMYHLFNTQNGIVGIPSVILFHNGRAVAKFNDSEYTLELFSKFVKKNTGIEAKEKSIVTSADFAGPVVSSPSKDSDMFLVLSWIFVFFCAIYYFTKSSWWKWILDTIQSNWREAEAQAEHLHDD